MPFACKSWGWVLFSLCDITDGEIPHQPECVALGQKGMGGPFSEGSFLIPTVLKTFIHSFVHPRNIFM